jgi:hypothetical protein
VKGRPDFTGRRGSPLEGLYLDITIYAAHLNPEVRFYGENMIVYGYARP